MPCAVCSPESLCGLLGQADRFHALTWALTEEFDTIRSQIQALAGQDVPIVRPSEATTLLLGNAGSTSEALSDDAAELRVTAIKQPHEASGKDSHEAAGKESCETTDNEHGTAAQDSHGRADNGTSVDCIDLQFKSTSELQNSRTFASIQPGSQSLDRNTCQQGTRSFVPEVFTVDSVKSYPQVEASSSVRSSRGTRLMLKAEKSVVDFSGAKELELPKWEGDCTSFLKGIVVNLRFEMTMTFFVVANAFVLACDAQFEGLEICHALQYGACTSESDYSRPHATKVFEACDWFFGIVFFFEALLKFVCFRGAYFCDRRETPWNMLDLACVLVFLIDKVASELIQIDGPTLRLVRLVRLMRLLRIIRRLEALDVLYVMATAIKNMSRILAWGIVLLTTLLMVCALFLTQYMHAQYFEGVTASNSDLPALQVHRELYEYFGTFTRCLLSMFEITLGNWPPVARLLLEHVSEWFTPLALLHKLTIGFAVVGVINGVILQETFKVAALDDLIMVRQKRRIAQAGKGKLVKLFESLDSSKDGELDINEFQIIADDPEVKTWLQSMDIETDDMRTLFMLLDVDSDGSVSVNELCERIPRIKGAARSIDALALRHKLNEVVRLLNANSEILANLSMSGIVFPRIEQNDWSFSGHQEPAPQIHTEEGLQALGRSSMTAASNMNQG